MVYYVQMEDTYGETRANMATQIAGMHILWQRTQINELVMREICNSTTLSTQGHLSLLLFDQGTFECLGVS